jgi:hypothetical protein
MVTESVPQGLVFLPEQLLARVLEEVEVTDLIVGGPR